MAQVYRHDELIMVVGYPDHSTAPIATGVQRSAGQALIDHLLDQDVIH